MADAESLLEALQRASHKVRIVLGPTWLLSKNPIGLMVSFEGLTEEIPGPQVKAPKAVTRCAKIELRTPTKTML
jgi:hypothetical protein